MAKLEISPSSTCVSLTPSHRQVVPQGTLWQRDTDQGNWGRGVSGHCVRNAESREKHI